jgi:hypothetical protein
MFEGGTMLKVFECLEKGGDGRDKWEVGVE